MLKKFLPDMYVKSIFDIDEEFLAKNNIKMLILDIDNTLVPHGADVTDEITGWAKEISGKGFILCIISNNNQERVELFNKDIGIDYIFKGGKPRKKSYEKLIDQYKMDKAFVATAGDQLLTDVLGGHNAGIRAVYVEPIDKNEPFYIKIKRLAEKVLMILLGFKKG